MPTLIKIYQALLPVTVDYKKELPNIIESIINNKHCVNTCNIVLLKIKIM